MLANGGMYNVLKQPGYGIDAIEFYYPRNYVDQKDLEKYNQVSEGKHTIGLGQTEMGFCADNEDIVSISLTVTRNLLKNYQISTDSIGCLVVGTETLIDKSKSVKTSLMDLFGENTNIEGVDIKNACFGGAQALLHGLDWVAVNYPVENKLAIVVVADIAVYEDGPARCTGGAGAMAFLIKPDAAIIIDRQLTACHMKNSWDFYKPIGANVSEYPVVDGSLSLSSYMEAVKKSYLNYASKIRRLTHKNVKLDECDAIFLHSPFSKMVQKGLAVMYHTERMMNVHEINEDQADENDRAALAKMVKESFDLWHSKTDPYLIFNRRIGNMYTPSLFAQLLAFLASDNCTSDKDHKILFFAYGSGFSSAIFPGRVRATESLHKLRETAQDAVARLESRKQFTAEEFTEILKMRERFLHTTVPAEPEALSRMDDEIKLFPNTFYLEKLDAKYRRTYALYEDIEQLNGNGVYH